MREAPTTEAPSGRAVASATWRPLTLRGALELDDDDGWSVGNRLPALPPGLSVGVVPSVTPGRLPIGSGVVVVIGVSVGICVAVDDGVGEVVGVADDDGVAGAVILTVAEAFGLWVRSVAVPVTATVSEVTVEDVVGTVVCA